VARLMGWTEKAGELVSIVIPAYNRSKYIERAVKSILNQTYENFEVIIVDDHSSDNTLEIANALVANDQRITVLRHDRNMGAQAARNSGIKAAKGSWIAFLDSDDEWLADSLTERYKAAIEQVAQVVHSECYVVRHPENIRKPFGVPPLSGRVFDKLLDKPGPIFPALLVRKAALESIGYLDEEIPSFQEWDTSIRLAAHYSFAFVPQPTFIYHCHSDETISKDRHREALGYEIIIRNHKEAIRNMLGRKGIGRHYEAIGNLYRNAGKMGTSRSFFMKALIYRPWRLFAVPYLRNVMKTFQPATNLDAL